jgi:hypothetical protein
LLAIIKKTVGKFIKLTLLFSLKNKLNTISYKKSLMIMMIEAIVIDDLIYTEQKKKKNNKK